MNQKKVATCFGGAMNILDSPQYLDSVEIGEFLAENKYIIKTGGYGGIMRAFSEGARNRDGHVVGCTCESFGTTAVSNEFVTEENKSKNLYERLRCLIEDEDDTYRIFIFQIGGCGTLAELFICLDLFRKMKNPPCMYLVGDHYKDIMDAIRPYMNEKEYDLVSIVPSKEELYKKIQEDESRFLDTQGE